ncbi:MAG: prepilin-type N-terminal cleavage/methylation domain-containing protein [Sedimentisphaeraceae bacterium JB056]
MTGKIRKNVIAKGFTLIELLVVISIIAVLMAIMMPALRKAREQAYRVVCGANMKQIGSATGAYMADNKYLWHDFNSGGGGQNYWGHRNYIIHAWGEPYYSNTPDSFWVSHGKLFDQDYVGTAKVFYCPADKMNAGTYDHHFSGDELKPQFERNFVRCNYISRNFNLYKGKVSLFKPLLTADKNNTRHLTPIKYCDSNMSILADRWTYSAGGTHGKKYYQNLYVDGHVESYNDSENNIAALGVYMSSDIDPEIQLNINDLLKTPQEALRDAEDRFGAIATDLQWAAGWLYFDHPSE